MTGEVMKGKDQEGDDDFEIMAYTNQASWEREKPRLEGM